MDPKRFLGVQSVVDAVEYLHSGKSVGKVWAFSFFEPMLIMYEPLNRFFSLI